MCDWACNRGECQGVATVATLGGGSTLGGGTTFEGGVTLVGDVAVAGSREGNTRGVFYLCGGACESRPSGVVGVDWGIGNIVSGALICGMRCLRMVTRRSMWLRLVVLRWCGMQPLILLDKVVATAMTRLEGVTAGFVRYLCLWKTVAETRVAHVSFIHIFQAQ